MTEPNRPPAVSKSTASRSRSTLAQCLCCIAATALLFAPAQAAHHRKSHRHKAAEAFAISASTPQELQFAVLDTRAIAEVLRDPDHLAGSGRVDIYLDQPIATTGHRKVVIGVDGASPRIVLDERNAHPITGDTLQRVERIYLAPGSHQLLVEIVDLPAAGAAAGPAETFADDERFQKSDGALNLLLQPHKGSLLHSKGIGLARWQTIQSAHSDAVHGPGALGDVHLFDPGSKDDPTVRFAHYLVEAGRPDDAVVELWTLQRSVANPHALSTAYWLESIEAERAAGLLLAAEALCDDLETRHVDPRAVATARLRLAEAEFENGDLQRTQVLLDRSHSALPEFMGLDWRFTDALLLFARDQNADALQVLKVANPDYVDAFRYMNDPEESQRSAGYRRFNLAVALLNHGQERLALSWLDLVGRYQGHDPDLLVLRDRANLALGWHFLKAQKGRTAIGALGRVSSEGLYANPALLGIGWCQLVPAGEQLARAALGDESQEAPDPFMGLPPIMKNSLTQLHVLEPELNGDIGPRAFEGNAPPADRKEGLRRAIQIWKVLAARDIEDPAVQEATLAIAYANGQLGERDQTRDAYVHAISQLRGVQDELDHGMTFIKRGQLAKAVAEAQDQTALDLQMDRLRLPPDDATRSLYAAIARYRDFGVSLDRLKAADHDVGSQKRGARGPAHALSQRIGSVEKAIRQQQAKDAREIEADALSQLSSRRQSLDGYLRAADLSLAAVADAATFRRLEQKSKGRHRHHRRSKT